MYLNDYHPGIQNQHAGGIEPLLMPLVTQTQHILGIEHYWG